MTSPAAPSRKWPMILIIVLGLALILSLWGDISFYMRAHAAETTRDSLLAEDSLQRLQWEDMKATNLSCESNLAAVINPGCKRVSLLGVGSWAMHRVDLFWNPMNGNLRAKIVNLIPPDAGKVYQLWAVLPRGEVGMGFLDMRNETAYLQEMFTCPAANAFVLTMEPKGGSLKPDLEAAVLAGVPD